MAINAQWHAAHPLARGASDEERLRWHRAHQKSCGCRPIPARLLARISKPKRSAGGSSAERPTRSPHHSTIVPPQPSRCGWASSDPLYFRYHDEEWGVPSHDERHLFEMLILEGAQAGLSWITILRKRDAYRRAFDRFDARKVAAYDGRKIKALLADEGIVRNRLKIESTIDNAKAYLAVQKEHGSFGRFVWSFVGGKPLVRLPRSLAEVPARTEQSDALSQALKKKGFRFVGSTICYAFMQACGLVNDHLRTCFRAPRMTPP
jgi:DNA-3-methyladenine glycosylase I